MPFNGAGVFQRVYSWVTDQANGVLVRADRMDTDTNDIASGLSNCMTRDGQSPPTANIPMGGYKITGLGNGASPQEAVTHTQVFDSPTFTSPSATATPAAGNSSTLLATTEFAMAMQSPSATGTIDYSGATLIKLPVSTLYGAQNCGGYILSNAGNAVSSGDLVNLQTAQALLSGGGTPANIPITSLGKGTATSGQKIRVNLAGTGIEGTPGWLRKTTTYTAVSFDRIKASTTGGAWSLTFPASPNDGDEIEVQDVDGAWNTNNLTLLPNGKTIMGFSTSFILNTRYAHLVFVYDTTLGDWRF